MKHNFLILILLICTCKDSLASAPYKSNHSPNIIFILVDDMGWGDLGVLYQSQRRQVGDRSEPWAYTPHLDAFAAQGAVLSQHYAPAPVCAPSRASLLLGVSQGHANVRDNQFDKALEDNHTMASTLRQIGYTTAAIGKWGLQGEANQEPDWPAHPLNRGFDYFLGYMRHVDGHEHYPKEGLYRGAKQVWENKTNIAAGLDKCYTADLWTAAAKRWIVAQTQDKDAEKPFFLYLAYDTPHAVLELPTQPYPKGEGLSGGMQWYDKKGQMISTAAGRPDSWIHPAYDTARWDHDKDPATPEVAWPEVYQRYATATRRIDDAVGDIMQLLKDLHIDDNTLVVFTSDNGPSRESYLPENYLPNMPDFFNSFGPFDGIKRDCWEGGIRLPTLVRWPGHVPKAQEITSAGALYDWAPTFLEAAGMPAPVRMDGISLLPALTGQDKPADRAVYVEYFQEDTTPDYPEFAAQHRNRRRNQMQVIRQGEMVGIRYDVQSAADDFEIYDVVEDPEETHNLVGEQGMDTLQQWMKNSVLQMRRPNASAPRPYDDALVPAIKTKRTEQGVTWKAYEGSFPWVPQVSSLQPSATGTAKNLDLQVNAEKGQGLYFGGYLNIPTDGNYTFFLKTTGKAHMSIHQASVIDADFGYQGEEQTAMIRLEKGLHPFQLCYAVKEDSGKPSLTFEWQGPGITRQAIPAEVFRME